MKRQPLRAFAAAAALLCLPSLAPSAAAAAPQPSDNGNPAVPYCAYEVLPSVPQANLGECVSYVIIPNIAFSTHDCDAWLEIDPTSFYAVWDSYSQCVRELRGTY